MLGNITRSLRSKFLGISIGWTLSLVLLLGLLPVLVMGNYYVTSEMSQLSNFDKELQGVKLLRNIRPVGDFAANPSEDIEIRRDQAKKALGKLQSSLAAHVGQEIYLANDAKLLTARLKLISQGIDVQPLSAYDNLVKGIGDQSGLILDPKLDSYYLMDMVLIKSTKLSRSVDELKHAYPDIKGSDDPLFLIKRHEIANATRELSEAMTSAVAGNANGNIERSKVPETTNQVISSANALIASKDINYDHSQLHRAIAANWETTSVVLESTLNDHKSDIKNDLKMALAVCGISALAVLLLAGLLILALTDGLRTISNRLADLSDGDYLSPVPGTEFSNDIGVIANALQSFIDLSGQIEGERFQAQAKLEQAIAKVQSENAKLLAETLSRQTEASDIEREMVTKLAVQLENQVAGLLAESGVAARQMKLEATAMSGSSTGVQKDATAAAHAADDIRKAVESVAPAVESVSRQLTEYTKSLGDAEGLATDAIARVDAANRRIGEFNTATQRAGSMLELITSVAHKTNMLALNASIEAARVGEAGMGFMVVAEEVKSLAQSTRNAALEISAQIASMEGANLAVTSAFEQVLEVVNTLASRSINVASGMTNQAEAITEVELAISAASRELSQMMQSIHSADDSAGAAIVRSNEVLAASENVSANFDQLDKTVRDFLSNIQNAQQQAA
jgi:methyl-accepting chemotaxis protein